MPPLPCGGGAIKHKSCQYTIYMSSITRARAINKKTRAGQSRYYNNTPALSRKKERAQKPNVKIYIKLYFLSNCQIETMFKFIILYTNTVVYLRNYTKIQQRTLLQKSSSSKTVTTKNLTKLRSHIINTRKEWRRKSTRTLTVTIIQIIL